MTEGDWVLGIDVGTSRSAGAMGDGSSTTPLEVEGNRWMPSMVLLDTDGNLVVGSAADYQAGVYPDRVERTPKRHLGSGTPLLLGDEAVEVPHAIARLIEVFLDEGRLRRGGTDPRKVVLTHPVRWGEDRRAALADSARLAGLEDPILVEEPVAAAVHYVGDQVEVGEYVGVYDLGGGTFDTAILQRTPDGFHAVGAPGGDEMIGGEHFDHLLYELLGGHLAEEDPELWEQVQYGEDRRWTRAAADLLTQARRAKEAVSSYPSTQVLLPLVDRDVVVTREQFEDMVRDRIEHTIEEMASTIRSAGLHPEDLTAIYLVGGSSRIPLVSRLMGERFGDRIATRDEPKSVVALGAAELGRRRGGLRGGSSRPPVQLVDSWRVPVHSEVCALGERGGSVLVADQHQRVHQFAEDGTWRFTAELPGVVHGAPALAGPTLVAGCSSGHVVGLDAATGRERYRVGVGGPVMSPLLVVGDVALVADDAQMLSGLGAQDGSLRWMLPVGRYVRTAMAAEGVAVLVPCTDGTVYRLDASSGAVSWGFPCPQPVTGAPVLAEGVAFIGSSDGVVYAVDLHDGRARWGARAGGPIDGPLAVWSSLVLVADRSGRLSAFERADGAVAWQLELGGTCPTGVLVVGSTAVVDAGDGSLVAVDTATGVELDRLAVPAGARHHPAAVGGRVVLGDGDGVRSVELADR